MTLLPEDLHLEPLGVVRVGQLNAGQPAGRGRTNETSRGPISDQGPTFRELTPQQRNALGLFRRSRVVTSKDVAAYFQMKPRSASRLCMQWIRTGFLEMENPSTKGRTYRLAARYETLLRP